MRTPRMAATPTTGTPSKPSYTTSVPMSVFREVSTDLRGTQNELTTLKRQNQQLLQQNQYLKLEMQRLAEQTQEVVNGFVDVENPVELLNRSMAESIAVEETLEPDYESHWNAFEPPLPQVPVRMAMPRIKVNRPQVVRQSQSLSQPQPILGFLQEARARLAFPEQGASVASELTGWKLTMLMMLIVLSAFGAGFLIVRPLMSNSQHQR
jgi:regulator of replication initiation timing